MQILAIIGSMRKNRHTHTLVTQVVREMQPIAWKPCGLVGVAEYSNPHQILEYLHDFCTVLKMRPALLDKFPYLGVAGQGDVEHDAIFNPLARAKDLTVGLMGAL